MELLQEVGLLDLLESEELPETDFSAPRPLSQYKQMEQAIRAQIRKTLVAAEPLSELSYLVDIGANAASRKILNVVEMLEDALNDKSNDADNHLVKTMRVARNAVLHINRQVEFHEGACMMQCSCMHGGAHYPWSLCTAGCHSQDSGNQSRIGGRLWDSAELLRLHHGYHKPRPVAQSTVYALRQLAEELELKESCLEREVKKISAENQSAEYPF